MTTRNFDYLLRPRSIAVIGASDRPGSVGAVVIRNVLEGGFGGPVYPVNARHAQVAGRKAWSGVAGLPEAPDLAVICTPAATVPGLVSELGARGTRAAVVLAAGLRSPGPDGRTMEQAMLDAARPHLLRILGPNCVGLLVPGIGLNASFAPGNAPAGHLAFVSQSGALATAMLDWASSRGLGFSHFISLGDSADADFGDLLDYLASDAGTHAILLYVESVKAARKFMSAARAASRNKPVIVVKAGRGAVGARAAASHTGAMAGSDAVFDAAAARAGMLRVDGLADLFDAAEALGKGRRAGGEALAVLTNGGGAGVLAADALSSGGGRLADLAAQTIALLGESLPPTWSGGNPVDIIGDAPPARHVAALAALLGAKEVDAVLFMHAPTALSSPEEVAKACIPLILATRKPVLACWLGGVRVAIARQLFESAGIPCFETPERGVWAWLCMVRHARLQRLRAELVPAGVLHGGPQGAAAAALAGAARAQGREWLGPGEAEALLAASGIPVLASRDAASPGEAAALAAEIGFPVALKVVSPQVVHKSDVGGVRLGLRGALEVAQAAGAMQASLEAAVPGAVLTGFRVQAMASRPHARELIAGISCDPVFGPVMLLGVGGTDVEIARRFAMALPPLNEALAEDLMARSGILPWLDAHRGVPAADRDAVIQVLLKLSALACGIPDVMELDINPLLADERGALALDARVRLHPPGTKPAPLAVVPYPAGLERTVRIAGSDLRLRPIRPEDGARLQAFYRRASPADLRMRFFSARRAVPVSELARFSQIDYDREMTFIVTDAAGDIVADARAVCDPDGVGAEFAIQVAPPWRRKGLGTRMLEELMAWLGSRGISRLRGECLGGNAAMLALARRAGMDVSGAVDGVVQLGRALQLQTA